MHCGIFDACKRPFKKDRLYVGLYAQDGDASRNTTYHWTLIVGPKADGPCCPAISYGVRQTYMMTLSGRLEMRWGYREKKIQMCRGGGIVARVMLGKVKDTNRLASMLQGVPMRPEVQDWSSVSWVKEGLDEIEKDGKCLGTSVTNWRYVRDAALQVAQNDAARRIETGEPEGEEGDRILTFDILLKKET